MTDPIEVDQEELGRQLAEDLANVLRRANQLDGVGEVEIEKHLASFDDKATLSDRLRQINFAYGPGVFDAIPSWLVRLKHERATDPRGDLNRDNALALLLINEVIFIAQASTEKLPEDYKRTVFLSVSCNDVFVWGASDCEPIALNQVDTLFELWEKDPKHGPTIWVMIERGEMPQRPVDEAIRKAGIWDLDALKAEHNLLANYYDGYNSVIAGLKYETYVTWCKSAGKEPRPFDKHWWDGWREYVAANPKWHNDTWQQKEHQLLNKWRIEHGRTPLSTDK